MVRAFVAFLVVVSVVYCGVLLLLLSAYITSGLWIVGASMGHFEILLLGTFTAGFYPILNPLFVLILDTADIIVRGSWDE
jgi:hypothetical protein